jgi:putative phosphoesterase
MRIALIGDIHGNACALEAALSSASELGADLYLNTGDLVGYYYQPKQVVDLIRGMACVSVRGNHEDMLFRCLTDERERTLVRSKYGSGIDVALEMLDSDDFRWLRDLPESLAIELDGRAVLLAHGAPWLTDFYVYPDAAPEVWQRVANDHVDITVLGHTHYQFDRQVGSMRLINPGSVGQPRDRRPGAAWSLLELSTMTVSHFRTQYDTQPVISEALRRDPQLPYLQTVLTRR